MGRATRAVVDLQALQHNLAQVRRIAPASRVMACIKANAYGHGAADAAHALADADAFAVACVDEAMVVRESGIDHPVVLLEGVFSREEASLAAQYRLEPVVHDPAQFDWLAAAPPESLRVWVKVDTGMGRLGFRRERLADVRERIHAIASVRRPLNWMTHLACSDDRADEVTTTEQIGRFEDVLGDWSGERSIANSAGILAWPGSHADWVRPGIMLYGVSPFSESTGGRENLKPVMTVSTRLIAIREVRRGERIGYGGDWTAPEDMPMGVAGIGYGDGYPRHAPSGTPVLVNGRRVPLAGRVSMDMITVDLRSQPDARVGDPVVLWGEGLPVEEVAQAAGTIGYELLCRLTGRVRFEVRDAGRVRRQSSV